MLMLFGLSSCIQVESTISVKKDGSGTITEELVFGEQMVMMMQMGAAQGGPGAAGKDPMAQMLDKTKAQARAKKMGEGVELVIAARNVDTLNRTAEEISAETGQQVLVDTSSRRVREQLALEQTRRSEMIDELHRNRRAVRLRRRLLLLAR